MISVAELQDVSELNVLVNSAYRGDSSRQGWTTEADLLDGIRIDEERLTELIQKPGSVILKYTDSNNKIVGCVHLERKGDKMYLGMLTVSPPLQAKGIGKELMKASEAYAVKQNCRSVYMSVITDRIELMEWYEKYGYKNTGIKKPFPMGDPRFGLPKKKLEFVILEKDLN
jgi:N-acetylglutamate synthase-like GNAT family acetyltransferase